MQYKAKQASAINLELGIVQESTDTDLIVTSAPVDEWVDESEQPNILIMSLMDEKTEQVSELGISINDAVELTRDLIIALAVTGDVVAMKLLSMLPHSDDDLQQIKNEYDKHGFEEGD